MITCVASAWVVCLPANGVGVFSGGGKAQFEIPLTMRFIRSWNGWNGGVLAGVESEVVGFEVGSNIVVHGVRTPSLVSAG